MIVGDGGPDRIDDDMAGQQKIPLFAHVAVQQGHLAEDQVEPLLREHLDTSQDDGSLTLANLCLRKGLLAPIQVQQIFLFQSYWEIRAEDGALGALAVKRGFADEEVVRYALDAQWQEYFTEKKLPRRLGTVLVEAEVLTPKQLETLQAERARAAKAEMPLEEVVKPGHTSSPVAAPHAKTTPDPLCGWLVVEFGDGVGQRIPLGERTSIGRSSQNQVEIRDPRISRQHARIEFDPSTGMALLIDLGSRNGTSVNQNPIREPFVLAAGDRIRCGVTVMRFEPAAEAAESPAS